MGKIVIKKSDGTTLYITRDIAAAIYRYRTYGFEKMFYVVGSQQNLHFQQLFKILELMGFDWAKKCHHINFGMITGMSTRKGTSHLGQLLIYHFSCNALLEPSRSCSVGARRFAITIGKVQDQIGSITPNRLRVKIACDSIHLLTFLYFITSSI